MCVHYTPAERAAWLDALLNSGYEQGELDLPFPSDLSPDMWPGRSGAFIRRSPAADADDAAPVHLEIAAGRWGLISALTRRDKLAQAKKLSTVNARDDRVQKSFTFGNAWRRGQHCIVPAAAIFEPDYRGPDGQPVAKSLEARIARVDGQALGLAGLWDSWTDEDGVQQLSYTVMTVNADDHALMRNYHRPNVEKRMLVMLPRGLYRDWLHAPAERSMDFLRQFPADRLQGVSPEREAT
jgi:putative SOS response-associated peptidase YedK